jgi:hypothetical protein
MLLKILYLEGHRIEKDLFLELARQGESNIAAGDVSGMSQFSAAILPTLPIAAWRERRRLNQQRLSTNLASMSWATILSGKGNGSCPFAGIIVCDTASRSEHIRQGLIARDVYPPVLWSLSNPRSLNNPILPVIPEADRQLWPRLLLLHCDMRYSWDDMDRVAKLVVQLGDAWHE